MGFLSLVINCLIIKNNIRELYIIDYDDISLTIHDINRLFPELHVEKTSYLLSNISKGFVFNYILYMMLFYF